MNLRSTGLRRASSKWLAALAVAPLLWASAAGHASAQDGLLHPGDAVVTGFPGVLPPNPAPAAGIDPLDETFINPDDASMRIQRPQPDGPPAGQLIASPTVFSAAARDVGEVFPITFDDAANPDIFLGATSAFGIQIVIPDSDGDGRPERVKTGQPGAMFMEGQWGAAKGGTAGSIYRVDGTTGDITLFTTIGANSGPGLGDVVFDRASHQFFVSDLDTGLIYRLDSSGAIVDTFDHGVTARPTHGLAAVADDGTEMDITGPGFNAEDPATWGYTQKERMVWGMAIHNGRLYYAVADGPQIWSIGINLDGTFAGDARWELDVAGLASTNPVSDMLFDGAGRMVLAQRGPQRGSYDYTVFAEPLQSSVVRYRREIPDDPSTPGTWVPDPDEYAIGLRPDSLNSTGGIALGYGYDSSGLPRLKACRQFLWTTGDSLRDNPAVLAGLPSGGPAAVHGLQGNDSDLVKPANDPPVVSYLADYDGLFDDPANQGHLGDVEIWAPCQGGQAYVPPYVPPPKAPPPSNLTLYKHSDPHTCQSDGFGGWNCYYTLLVRNTGSTVYWGPLGIDDWLPANPPGATISFDPSWSCGPVGLSHYHCDYPPVVLYPGEGIDLYMAVSLPAGSLVCHLTNGARLYQAFGFGDSNPNDDTDFASATVPNPLCPGPGGGPTNLKLTKDKLGDCFSGPFGANWLCGYVVTIANAGLGNYTGDIVFTDTLSVGAPILGIGPGWLCTIPGPAHTCTLPGAALPGGVLVPGDSVQVQIWTAIPKAGFSTCFVNDEAKITAAPAGSPMNMLPGDDFGSAISAVPIPGCKPPGSTNLSIKKTENGLGCYLFDPGGGAHWYCNFTITVTNESLLNNFFGAIAFHDTLPGIVPLAPPTFDVPFCGPDGGGYTCSTVAPLGPGVSGTVHVYVEVPNDGSVCSITNKVDLTIPPGGGFQNTSLSDDHSEVTIPVPAIGCPTNLQITKTRLGGDFCSPAPGGWTCPYSVEVRNTGPLGILGAIQVKEEVPAGLGFVWDGTVVGCVGGPPVYTCTYVNPGLAAGDSFTFAATIFVPTGYPVPPDPAFPAAPDLCHITNKVSFITPLAPVNGIAGDDQSQDTLRIAMVPDPAAPPGAASVPCDPPSLKLQKMAEPKLCAKVGSNWECSFHVRATSTGPDPYHGTVELDETLPAGSTLKSFSAPWTCVGAAPAVHCSSPNVNLAIGDSVDLMVTVTLPDSAAKPGKCDVTNTVQATISAAVLHSATAAQYMASATATIPAEACVIKKACPVLQKQPDGGCCPDGQVWLGTACGVRSAAKCPAGTSGTPPDNCLCPDGKTKLSARVTKCPVIVIKTCPDGSSLQGKPAKCICDDGSLPTGKPAKCNPPLQACPPGSSGTAPDDCVCSDGSKATGVPLRCKLVVRTCPDGSSLQGKPARCVCEDGSLPSGKPLKCRPPFVPLCPRGSTPTSAGCLCLDGSMATGNPLKCKPVEQACPPGSIGTAPDKCFCRDGSKPTGSPPKCAPPPRACPKPSLGFFPNCRCPDGWSGTAPNGCLPPAVQLCPKPSLGIFPKCTCPTGWGGTPPNDCIPPLRNVPGTTSVPKTCGPNEDGTPPNCTCKLGFSGEPPNCKALR